MIFLWKFKMAILKIMKKDPIADLTEEIRDLKTRIISLETKNVETKSVEANVKVKPQEKRTAIYTIANDDFIPTEEVEEEIPFLPKPKFGEILINKLDTEKQDLDTESVKKLREKKCSASQLD